MAVEIGYRIARLRTQADNERLAAVQPRGRSPRRWVGRALVAFGRLVEGAGAREGEPCPPVSA